LSPAACVVVATVRALKMHGGAAKADLAREDLAALRAGLPNLLRHVENMRKFGLPVVVALNSFTSDTVAEMALVQEALSALGTEAVPCTHWADGAPVPRRSRKPWTAFSPRAKRGSSPSTRRRCR
jgi:formate--tetrahydrofolate ligase